MRSKAEKAARSQSSSMEATGPRQSDRTRPAAVAHKQSHDLACIMGMAGTNTLQMIEPKDATDALRVVCAEVYRLQQVEVRLDEVHAAAAACGISLGVYLELQLRVEQLEATVERTIDELVAVQGTL